MSTIDFINLKVDSHTMWIVDVLIIVIVSANDSIGFIQLLLPRKL